MHPIPDSLIASRSVSKRNGFSFRLHSRFCLPLIYLVLTACLCYSFLFALVISSQNTQPSGRVGERGFTFQQHISSSISEKLVQQTNTTSENSREKLSLSLSPSVLTLSTSRTPDPLQRKTLFSLRRKTGKRINSQNGSRRSYPTKIRTRHQDLECPHSTTNNIPSEAGKVDGGKSSVNTEIYRYPWKDDEECKKFNISFAKQGTFKPRALVSFPGSGNSWIRYLIENASGYFTGSVYNDTVLFQHGLMGEQCDVKDGTTIVQKTHHRFKEKQKSKSVFGYRGIFIIRNPYDAIVSYRNYRLSKCVDKHQGLAKGNSYRGPDWTKFVLHEINEWSTLITTWLANSSDFLIVLYEDVLENPRLQLTRILEYLKQPTNTERLDCLMKPKNLEGPFHRVRPLKNTSNSPLTLDSIPSSPTAKRKLDTATYVEQQLKKVNSSARLQTDSKQPHQKHHRKSQSTPQLLLSSRSSILFEERKNEEQKEDKFSPSKLSSINSSHQQQNQYARKMTSGVGASSSPIGNTDSSLTTLRDSSSDHNNNRLNKGSILRLDLIIQDNIDKINSFFKQKSIPVHLHYSPRPSILQYFL